MTNFNFLSNLAEKNEVNRALAAEKTLQNAGGGTSQGCTSRSEGTRHKALIIAKQFSRYCVSQSEGTQVTSARSAVDVTVSSYGAPDEHPMSIRSASDGERWQNRVWKYVAMIFAVLVMSVGQMWGETYTWSFANGSGTIAKTTTNFTSTSGSKTLIYDGGDGCAFDGDSGNKYLKMGGKSGYSNETPNDRFFKFLAPSSSGTVSISYAGTVNKTEISAGSNGSLVWDVITPTANETSTSKIISGLTAGSTYVYISCPDNKSYIKSITWTDAALPYERVYYSEMKTCVWETALEPGASFTAHNSIGFNGKAGSGWNSYFSNYLTVSASNGYATATFSSPLSLTSNGVDKGRIRVYFSGGENANKNLSLEMNGNSAGSYSSAVNYRTYVAEYTIPDATENLSTLKMYQSGNSGIVIFAIEVLTYSSSTWYLPGSWYNNFERANNVKFTGSPLTLTLHLDEHTSYDFKLVKNNGSETWYDNSGGKVITTMRDWSIAGTSGGNNSVLFTGPEGDYTFTLDPGNQTLDIDYPNIHPDDNYMYFENTAVWGTVGAYIYSNKDWEVTSWDGTPSLANSTVEICGHTYHYCVTPRYSNGGTFENVIFRNLANSGQSSARSAKKESHGGKWSDNNSATIHEFNLYTISFAGNENTGGTMDAITGICPNSNWALPANTFEKTDNIFSGWHANVATKVGGSTVAIGGDIADEATLQEINSDITLTAQWTECSGPSITAFSNSEGHDYNQGDAATTMSITASAGNGGALHYHWYQYNVGQDPATQSVDAAGYTDANTYTPSTASAHGQQIFYCVVSEEGCSKTVTSAHSGAIAVTAAADPCDEPEKLTNEIARFFVPCNQVAGGAWNPSGVDASTDDNTFTITNNLGGSGDFGGDNWKRNATTGFKYGKMQSSTVIQLTLKSGSFRAGDVVTAYVNSNSNALQMNSGSSKAFGTQTTSGYNSEYQCSITLAADNIESDGSIKIKRTDAIFVNRIIVTREPACFEITDAKKPDSGWTDRTSSAQEITSSMLKGTISGGTVLYSGTGTLNANETYGLVFDDNNDEITITLSGTTLPAGALIVIGARGRNNTDSHQCGFVVSGNSMSPATTTSSTKGNSFTQTYTVKASDGIIGGNTFTIKRVTDKDKTYLESLYIIGCEEVSCADFTVTRGGQESGTFTVGSYGGSALTCTPSPAGSYTYAWKQYPTSGTPETAVAAEGTGNNTNSFTPNPASAGTYIYFCDVTDACSTTKRTSLTGAFTFNAAPAFTASTSVNIEQGVLTNSKKWDYQSALTAANITSDLTTCELDSLDDACNKTDRNNDYLGLKIKAGDKYIQMNVPSGKTLKVRFGKRAEAVKVWIDGVAQTDIPTTGNYYTYELALSGSNRVVKIATADGQAVVIKQIMIGEDIKTVTLPAKVTCGATTNGTISVASAKVNVGSTVTVTATPASGYELETLTYTPACPDDASPVDIKTAKQFTMPNGNVTINATFTAAAPATYSITYDCDGASSGCPAYVAAATNLPSPLPSAPTKDGYTFDGWYTNSEKTVDAVAGAALTGNVTLYAKWTEDECTTPTTLFSMVVNPSAADYKLSASTEMTSELTSRLTSYSGGTPSIYNTSTSSNKDVIKNNTVYLGSNDVYLKVVLSGGNTLQAGDVITITTRTPYQPYITKTTTRTTTPTMTKTGSSDPYTYSITLANTNSASGKDIIDAGTLYFWKNSSAVEIRSITITRPCDESAETCKTPNITNIASTTNMTTAETKSLNVTLGNADALTGTVTYAWTNADSSPIAAAANASGANTARLTLTKPAADTYTFKCTVTNNCGGEGSQSATSAVFTVNVAASAGCTEIAKVIVSGASAGTGSGTKIAETSGYVVNLENTKTTHDGKDGYKLGSSKYVYLQLASGEQFQNGDKVKVYITNLSDQGDHNLHIFQGTTAAGTEVATVASPALGWNEATLSGVTSGQRSLTIHRSSGTTEQNHGIYAFAVERCVDCTPATHEGLAYTETSYTVGATASALTVTNPENVDTYQWKWNTTGDRTIGSDCGTGTASFTPPVTAEYEGTRYYWCELTNDCGTVKTSAVGITVSAVLSDVTVTWTDPAEVNYGGGGYTIKATVDPAAWDGTLDASMLTAPEGIRIYDVEINNTEHTLQAKFDVQTTFDREANATAIPFALTLDATASYDGKIDKHNVAYEACAGGGGGGLLFSQNFNSATEVAYTNGTETAINTSSGNNIVGNTAASQFTYIGIVDKSFTGIAINTESGGNSQDITGAFQAYANNTAGKYALVKTTNFAAPAPTALRIEADVWFHTLSSSSNYSLSFAVGESFSDGTGGASASNVHSGFSFYNASAVYLYAYKDKNTKISGTNQFTQSAFQKVTWVINNTGDDLEYTNPAGTKSTLANDKFDVWVGTTQFVSGQAATTPAKALQNLYIGDPNGKGHEFRLDNVTVTDISTSSGTGSLPTALTWSNDQKDGETQQKDEGTADFAITANRSGANALASLGTISYSSSAPSVATVNETTGQVHIADNIDFGTAEYKETTITATLAASGCYKRAEITYVLRVNKHACEDVAGTVTSTSDGCTTTLTLSGYTAGATIQWYKDGVSLGSVDGAQTATYETTASGEYYAVTSNNCDRTSNTVTVTSTAVSATKIVDEWYVKNGRRTPDIALVQTMNATGLTVTTGSPASDITSTGIGGCGFYLGTDGIIYLKGAKNDGTAPSDMTEGDTEISITASGCTDATPVTITIHRQVETDKYVLAYVVTGDQDGGWTQNPPSNQTTGVELYRTLTNHFDVQATNIYATTDEQKIKEYYSRYDIIFITDYPNTKTKNETTKKSYVDALGAMIDIRPILTMEAWVSGLANWSEKGVKGSPKSPTTRQYNMLLQCKDHEIFSSTTVETIGEGDDVKFKINMVDSTKVLYDTLDTKYGAGAHAEKTGYCYGKHPALQGFVYDEALADMLPLGLIDDGAGNNLQVGLERQKEMEARMMVLGINADAMERLSKDGETVIVNALKYLMKKDAEDIMDCSIYFDNAGGNNLWSNVANWGPSHLTLPQPTQEARILQPCIVDGEANAASIKIISGGKYNHGSTEANGSLTIAKSGILKVGGRIVAASAPSYYEVRPTDASRLIIQADDVQTGALIHGHKSGELNATVQLVSKAYSERVEEGGKIKTKKYWQYVGLPVQEALAEDAFYGGYTYKYEESAGWEKKRTGDMLEEFWGIGLSYDNYVLGKTSPITFNISGALALATNRDIELTKTAEAGNGENMIGNSWTAPIHLVNMTAEDFENATATIYLFNTGRSAETAVAGTGDNGTAGQWRTIPVVVSKLDSWVGPKVIPAMQAFEVDVADDGSTSGTLHLNYDKHVRAIATPTDENAPLLAPKRYMSEEPSMMRLRVADTATYTDLYLIEGEQLSDEFDNGWDGKYQQCDGRSATLYALSPIGNMAVLAQQSVNNTAVVFRPGRQSEYTFTFGYDGEVTYYLNDLLLEKSTEIREGNEYRFTYNEGDMESRFVVSSTPFESPNVTTGIGGVEAQEKVQKVVYKDHVYIIRGGKIYDVMGKMMK